MATACFFIDDIVTAPCIGLDIVPESGNTSQKAGLQMFGAIDEGLTTDVGQTSASDAESSSGLSSDEGSRKMLRRCRFGKTSLETLPATPTAAAMSLNSPPGLSRAAMREERDACKKQPSAETSQQNSSESIALATPGVTLSRFGETSFGTVPKTPVGKANVPNCQSAFGSPPGLSRAEKRRARDACKGSWGSCGVASALGSASVADQRSAAREALASMKERAARLKDMKIDEASAKSQEVVEAPAAKADAEAVGVDNHSGSSGAEEAVGVDNHSESSGAEEVQVSGAKERRCRFAGSALGTMPSTPVRKETAVSPPGLSRKAMRQARDSCTTTSTYASTSWGTGNSAAFTISPAGKPMTPPTERAARWGAARDATTLAWGVSMPLFPQTSAVAR